MKDKITVVLVCVVFIGIVWISSTSNTTFSNNPIIGEEIISIPVEDTTMEFIDNGASESIRINEAELQTEISAINTCNLESIATDALTFSEAFGYYRQCRGDDSRFQWKSMEYTTQNLKLTLMKIRLQTHSKLCFLLIKKNTVFLNF